MISEEEIKVIENIYLKGSGYVREISRELKMHAITVSRILSRALEKGMVNLEEIGNVKKFSLNYTNSNTISMVSLIENRRLERIRSVEPVIKNLLDDVAGKASIMILYGSSIRNKDFKDVDILFVSDKSKKIIELCSKVSLLTGKIVSPHILTSKKFFSMIDEREVFIVNTILKPENRIFVFGLEYFLKTYGDSLNKV